ncbi:MAG: hypothetical protein JSS43_18940 [Proteobacteria bacterium]|nr:hypothetical protein [Pseudomonadota bacterium]
MPTTRTAEPTFTTEKPYLLARIAGDLAPTLADKPADRTHALQMAWRIVRSYQPATEAEVLGAARIASLSMMQLDLTREATQQADLTPTMKLKFARTVVALNSAVSQTERSLDRRQRVEERRPLDQQPVEPERINRTSNEKAVEDAFVAAGMEEYELMRAVMRQQQQAASPQQQQAAPPAPPRATPVADPVTPPAETATPTPPPGRPDIAEAFARHMGAVRAQHHEALRAAAAPAATPRTPGAGPRPPESRAAGAG